MKMGTICFTSASKTYAGATGVRALEDVNFTIGDGEFVALLGPSGCGKSTLLNLVAGFEALTEGTMTFENHKVTRPGPDRGVVFQEASLLPWLSVWENVVFGPKVQKITKADYEPRATEMLRIVGLENFHDALPIQLSGGMRQRVGIARALVMQPRALLMDEPFGALDAQTRLSMQQLLLDVWQKLKTTVLFVTHDIDEAILLADRVCVMTARPGRIIRDIPITLRRPRSIDDLTSADFTQFKAMIMAEMRGTHRHH
jgi:NitT/TauT family transport system ATP-binding protein